MSEAFLYILYILYFLYLSYVLVWTFLSSLTCQLVCSWSHDFDFFALYCRNSNVQYQGPFKVRPWISERWQSFPILSQKRNWHNWSNNSSYTLYNPISCMIKSVQIENCNAMHIWWCGWIVSPILANYPRDPTVHKGYYVTQSQKKTGKWGYY